MAAVKRESKLVSASKTATEVDAPKSAADSQLPAHLQGQRSKAKLGNTDQSDLIIPRVKLLQAISEELTTYDNAKAGVFWHTILNEPLGSTLSLVPVLVRKSYVLWAPRGDDRGILCRANDAIHWDVPAGTKFEVKLKNGPTVTYEIEETVGNLAKFGSSNSQDPGSTPAAALTYEFMFISPDHLDYGPFVVINTRSSAKRGKDLISKIDMRSNIVDHFGQKYKMGITTERGDEGPYNNYSYVSDGFADEDTFKLAKSLHEKFGAVDWKANEEGGDTDAAPTGKAAGPSSSSKF